MLMSSLLDNLTLMPLVAEQSFVSLTDKLQENSCCTGMERCRERKCDCEGRVPLSPLYVFDAFQAVMGLALHLNPSSHLMQHNSFAHMNE